MGFTTFQSGPDRTRHADAAGRSPLPSSARAGQRLAPVAAARCPRTPGISSVRTPALPRGAPPFEGFPSLAAVPPRAWCRDTVHPWSLPPRRSSPSLPQLRRIRRCRGAGFSLASSTSRPCSARESVAPMNVAAQLRPILPWAWSSCQMPEVTATGPHRSGAPAAAGRHTQLGFPRCLRLWRTSRPGFSLRRGVRFDRAPDRSQGTTHARSRPRRAES